MHPGGYNPRPNTAPYGAYGYRNGTNAPPYRHQPPPQQMTPQEKEEILLAAGRLAAEYLVSQGELPAHALRGRPPAPLPFQQRRPAPPFSRPFLHERPLARQHFHLRPPPAAPRQFQQQRPSFAPRPFQGQGRTIAKRPRPPFHGRPPFFPPGARGSAAPAAEKGRPGQGAAAPAAAAAGSVTKGGLNDAPAGDGNIGQPVAPPSGDAGTAQSTQTMDHQAMAKQG